MAKKRKIIITQDDLRTLRSYLGSSANRDKMPPHLVMLLDELDVAQVVASDAIPPDVVTLYSTVEFTDLGNKETFTYRLVPPPEGNPDDGKLPITAPLGAALLGYRCGDVVEWPVPGGVSRIRIDKVLYQPEHEKKKSA